MTDDSSEIGRKPTPFEVVDNSEVPPAALVELDVALRYSLRWATIPEPARSQLRENRRARRAAQDGAV